MPVESVEVIGRSLDATYVRDSNTASITRQYYLHGPAEEDEVYAALEALPPVLFGFPRSDVAATEEDEIAGDWRATVKWTVPRQALNTIEYRFNFTAPSAHISQSLSTKSWSTNVGTRYAEGDLDEINAASFGGAINVVEDGGKHRVEGIDLAPPPEVFVLTFVTETGFVTRAYQQKVEALCGHVNNGLFFDCAAGTLLLARVSGGKSAEDIWSIEFGFSFIANRSNIPVGPSITVPSKEGHDLLWVFYTPTEDANYYGIVPRPEIAIVEEVWPRANFDDLEFPF